jgi:hypothetical protein
MVRILPGIDYDALDQAPRPIISYWITALHAAVQRGCRLISYHGPTARDDGRVPRDLILRAAPATDSCGVAANGDQSRPREALAGGWESGVLSSCAGHLRAGSDRCDSDSRGHQRAGLSHDRMLQQLTVRCEQLQGDSVQ